MRSRASTDRIRRRLLAGLLLAALACPGSAAADSPAQETPEVLPAAGNPAGEVFEVLWTAREDFADNAPGVPGRAVLVNVDLDSEPGALTLARPDTAGVPAGEPVRLTDSGQEGIPVALACGGEQLGCLAVWLENRPPNVTLRGALLGPEGRPRGETFSLAPSGSFPSMPAAAFDPVANQFLVLWVEFRSERWKASSHAILGRRVGSRGARALGEEFVVARDSRLSLLRPQLAWAPGAGRFLAVWQRGEGPAAEILARRIGAGGPVGEAFAATAAPGAVSGACVASGGGDAGWLLAWSVQRAGGVDVVGRAVTPSGALAGGEIALRSGEQGETRPFLAGGPGAVLLLWEDNRAARPFPVGLRYGDIFQGRNPSAEIDVYVQLLDPAGGALGPERLLVGALRNQLRPAASWTGALRQYVAVWQDARFGYEYWDIGGRAVEADGTPAAPGRPVADLPDEQFDPSVSCFAGSERCLVAWWGPPGRGRFPDVHVMPVRGGPATGVISGLRVDTGSDRPRRPRLTLAGRIPPGTAVTFRARSAWTEEELTGSPWSHPFPAPGWTREIIGGRWVELEATLAAGPDGAAPVVEELRLAWPPVARPSWAPPAAPE